MEACSCLYIYIYGLTKIRLPTQAHKQQFRFIIGILFVCLYVILYIVIFTVLVCRSMYNGFGFGEAMKQAFPIKLVYRGSPKDIDSVQRQHNSLSLLTLTCPSVCANYGDENKLPPGTNRTKAAAAVASSLAPRRLVEIAIRTKLRDGSSSQNHTNCPEARAKIDRQIDSQPPTYLPTTCTNKLLLACVRANHLKRERERKIRWPPAGRKLDWTQETGYQTGLDWTELG